MVVQTKPLAEITQEAIQLLFHELGVVDTVRFLNQFTPGMGNYTEERKTLFENVTLPEVIDEIKRNRKNSESKSD
jgi:hypothetical protein